MEDDLKMAREIQLTMLPSSPSFPRNVDDQRNVFEFTHRYLPREPLRISSRSRRYLKKRQPCSSVMLPATASDPHW
jgi:hypothetical protein